MNKCKGFSKMWFLGLLLVAFVAGCASNADEIPVIPDTTVPTVSFTSPANGALAVPYDRKVSVAFSEAMDPATITEVTFKVTDSGGVSVPGKVTPVGTAAIFTPTSSFANSTPYIATITTGTKDLAGNALAANYVWTFTTGTIADAIPPTVSVTSPADKAPAVPFNRKVGIAFSEAMNPTTITAETFKMTGPGLTPVTGTVAVNNTSAVFTPSSNLVANTLYTVTVTNGVKDLAENAMVNNYIFTFTTLAAADSTKPTVIATVNANNAINVPTNAKAGATFSEVMDPMTITSTTFTLKQGGTNVSGIVTYSGTNAVFTPLNNLAAGTKYTATITTEAKDLSGNALANNYVWSWTTAAVSETVKPTVILVNPLDLATNVAINSAVHATFSEAMDPLTISTATFTLKNGLNSVDGTVEYVAQSKMASFTPKENLATGTTYTATITTGAEDLAGNALAGNQVPSPAASNYVWSFTTSTGTVPPPVSLINLGSASAFGIMATSAITNTGAATMVNGDVSLDPGSSCGLLPVQVNGTIHINDTVSAKARIDLLAAYDSAKALAPGVTVPGGMDLGAFPNGGLPGVLPPGTYTSGSTMLISTPLTLDAKGDANASWVFQIGSSLITTNSVSLINGAQAKNVYWVPTASATVGVGTIFNGNIIAGVSATGKTGAVINGRILAGATNPGTIALDTNTVNVPAQ